jgi:hypothetical protein
LSRFPAESTSRAPAAITIPAELRPSPSSPLLRPFSDRFELVVSIPASYSSSPAFFPFKPRSAVAGPPPRRRGCSAPQRAQPLATSARGPAALASALPPPALPGRGTAPPAGPCRRGTPRAAPLLPWRLREPPCMCPCTAPHG